MKVLIVDNDPIITTTLETSLNKWGYLSIVATSSEQAWEELHVDDAPIMVILDWVLPGVSGIELCKSIKSHKHGKPCYIIMLTGRMSTDDVVVGLEAGADDYLIKPVDNKELKARILAGKRILDQISGLNHSNPTYRRYQDTRVNWESSLPKVLITEDDPVSREVLKENIVGWGFSVVTTTNGREAIQALKLNKGPLIVIVDWIMPEMSGIEVCREIKHRVEDGAIYIILLTAKSQKEDIVEGLEAGADDYLTKPFHSAELKARINVGLRILSVNQHIKAIVLRNTEGIITFNKVGLIESFNPAAERLFAYGSEEIIGQNILVLVEEGSHNQYHEFLKNITSNFDHESASIELSGIRKNKTLFFLEINIAHMDYDGQMHFVCIIRDISAKKRIEEELIAAKKMAEYANKAKTQFISSMSHELRTPLNAILGFAQLLATDTEAPLNDDQQEAVDYILKGGNHLLSLINEILDLATIESGKVGMDLTVLDIDSIISDAVSLMKQLLASNHIELIQSSTTERNKVKGDSSRLHQILLNLLSNAIKYNCDSGKVFVEKSLSTASILRVTIRDTGQGISTEKQSEIFKPFNRLGADKTEIEGTGIGLHISKTLIEKMGGNIGFESEPGKGSTFWIEIPTIDVLSGEDDSKLLNPPSLPPTIKSKKPPFSGKATLLYIEDNMSNVKLMEQLISKVSGLSLLVVKDAEQGIDTAVSQKPNLILMDMELPDMNGKEALNKLKLKVETENIPVIALSANAMCQDIETALAEGFEDYIAKPFEFKEFLTRIFQVLGDRRSKPRTD